jgi:hypothetical protein
MGRRNRMPPCARQWPASSCQTFASALMLSAPRYLRAHTLPLWVLWLWLLHMLPMLETN